MNPIPSDSMGGINTYGFVAGNPVSYIDLLGLTQCDIDTARRIALDAKLRLDSREVLLFPDSYGSRDLGDTEDRKRKIVALTIPGVGTILSDEYQKVLTDEQAADLLFERRINNAIMGAVFQREPAHAATEGVC